MMTLYLTFQALKQGQLSLQQSLPISEHAASRAPTNLALRAGDSITVEQCILGLVTRSANDAASVLAEALAGDEDRFAQLMTYRARQLGMSRTTYKNASGLPDVAQVTTARDQATLGLALQRHFPEYYPYFRTRSFTFRGRTYTNHNRMLANYPGTDGMKTGYVRMSGFNIVTSATRADTRLVGVVMGGTSAAARDKQMVSLLDKSFAARSVGDAMPRVAAAETQPVPEVKTAAKAEAQQAAPTQLADASANLTKASVTKASAASQPSYRLVNTAAAPKQQGATKLSKTAKPSRANNNWAVQLGAYRNQGTAQKVVRLASGHLRGVVSAPRPRIAPINRDGVRLYQVRLTGLDKTDALDACGVLTNRAMTCKTIKSSDV
jgi:D-alanyl-D-alanine carboxypeptidase